jgi:hypothetical protein
MHGSSCVPPAGKNEEADEEIEYAHNTEVIFNCGRPLGGLDNELNFKILSGPLDLIMRQ